MPISELMNRTDALKARTTDFAIRIFHLVEALPKSALPDMPERYRGPSPKGAVGDLIRVMGSRMEKIADAEPEDVQWNAQQLEKELDIFGKTPAYRALRAQDKRKVIVA